MRSTDRLVKRLLTALGGVLMCTCAFAQVKDKNVWPTAPSMLVLTSDYGTLHVDLNEYIYESILRIDNQPTNPEIRGLLNITYAFKMPNAQAALVSINRGNTACPISYRWVLLQQGKHRVSPEFVSCSEKIRVSIQGRKLNIETPNRTDPAKIDVYAYDGGANVSYSTI